MQRKFKACFQISPQRSFNRLPMRRLFSLLLLFLSFAPLQAQIPPPAPPKPNVLFIVVDDLSEYVGFLNEHPQSITPNMDRLARRGTIFMNAFCSSPQCSPSRTSMLSGKLPDYTAIYEGGQYNDGDFRSNFHGQPVFTLPEVLKDSGGYFTTGVRKIFHGRNHSLPANDLDVDESTSDNCARGKSWSRWNNSPSNEIEPIPSKTYGWDSYEWGGYDNSLEVNAPDYRATSKAIDLLEDYIADPGNFCDRPLFLALGIFRPHIPYYSPEKYFSDFYQPDPYQLPYRKPYNDPVNAFPPNGNVPAPWPDAVPSDYVNLPFIGKTNANGNADAPYLYFKNYPLTLSPLPIVEPGLSDSARESILGRSFEANSMIAYLASIRFADAQVGRILDALESQPGVMENTIIVLISDHGYAFGEKLHHGKVALWDQVARVPMIVVDPRKPGNRVSYRPVSLLDIFPTLLELTGTPEPKLPGGGRYLDGESFANLLDDPEAIRTKPVLVATELSRSYADGYCYPMHSVFDQRFHYIRYITNGPFNGAECDLDARRFQEELYEIGERRDVDPNEFVNLANDPAYQGIKSYLAQYLPDGPLYNESGGKAEILLGDISCILNLSSNHVVKGRYTRSNGTSFSSPPEGFVFEWSSPAFFAPFYGDSVVLGSSTINSALLPTLKRLPLTLKVVDTASGLFFETVEQIEFKSISVPSSTFAVAFPEPGVVRVTLNSLTGIATSRIWDFGDGVTIQETHPAPHRYSHPGEYLIRHTAAYGNDPGNSCTRKEEVLVTIDSAAFLGQPCPTPLYLSTSSVASNNAKLKWEAVFGANRYEFRARSIKFPDVAWFSNSKSENFVVIPGLKPNEEYEYQVRAICPAMATDTSDWSYPHIFKTPTCFAPLNLNVDDITATSVSVEWLNQSESVGNHEVLARALGGGPIIRIPVSGGSSALVGGLIPSTTYELAVRPRCPNASGGPGAAGPLTQKQIFTTLSLRQEALLTDENSLQLQPNPAAELVQIQLQGQGGTLRIMDAAGRLFQQQSVLSPVIELSVSSWQAGFYLVEWLMDDGQAFRKKLLIQH